MTRPSPWSDQPDTDGPEYLRPDEPEFVSTVAELTTVVVPDVWAPDPGDPDHPPIPTGGYRCIRWGCHHDPATGEPISTGEQPPPAGWEQTPGGYLVPDDLDDDPRLWTGEPIFTDESADERDWPANQD